MSNEFHSDGGEQNIEHGDNAIGKQVNVTQSVHGNGNIFSGTGNVTVNGIPPEVFAQYVSELGVTDSALASFFKILEEQQVSRGDLDSKLREIAFRYKELLLRFEAVMSDDPQVQALKEQAKQAIEDGDYDRADALLNQAKERDRAAVATLKASLAEQQAALEKRQLSEAQSCVDQAKLQRLQYRYEKSAQYWQEAAAALPEGYEWDRAACLGAAGEDLYLIARYPDALRLFEQSLSIFREIGNRKHEGILLSNISQVHQIRGEYKQALVCLEQSLAICREVADKQQEGITLNNISKIYFIKGNYPNALSHIKQSIQLCRKTNNKKCEGECLAHIGIIYCNQGDYTAALEFYSHSLVIAREIKDKMMESIALNNISQVYQLQWRHDEALEYLEQSLSISRQISTRQTEGIIMNNIAVMHEVKGNYQVMLKYFEQALTIAKEIGDKNGEAVSNFNVGSTYEKQGELTKAKPYLSRAVELMEQLEHPKLKECRLELKMLRFMLWTWPRLFAWIFRSLFLGR